MRPVFYPHLSEASPGQVWSHEDDEPEEGPFLLLEPWPSRGYYWSAVCLSSGSPSTVVLDVVGFSRVA